MCTINTLLNQKDRTIIYSRHPSRRDAFTLIELLAVIGVVAVLIALTLPALRGVRLRANEAVALSNIRGIGSAIEAYANTQNNTHPFHRFGGGYQQAPLDGLGGAGTIYYDDPWAMFYLWPSHMHAVAPWRENYRSWLNVGVQIEDPVNPWNGATVSYHYSNSFIARPEMWADLPPAAIESREALFAPTFTHEVRSPSLKALMYDGDRAYLYRDPTPKDRRAILTADGAAALRLDSDSLRPVQNRYDNISLRLFHDTASGVRGRDYN